MVNHKQSKNSLLNPSSKAEKTNAVNNIAVTSAKSNNSDYESVVATEYSNEHNINSPRSIPQYAILKYGDDSQLIFNINCQVQHVIDYFTKKCQQTVASVDPENLEICDSDGKLVNMNRDRWTRTRLSSEFLKPREVYVLTEIKPMMGSDGTRNFYYNQVYPLITNSSILTHSFLAKLNPKIPKHQSKQNLSASSNNARLNHRNSISNLSNASILSSTSTNNEKSSQVVGQSNGNNSVNNTTNKTKNSLKKQ